MRKAYRVVEEEAVHAWASVAHTVCSGSFLKT